MSVAMATPEKFAETIVLLRSPARRRVWTNNDVERVNRTLWQLGEGLLQAAIRQKGKGPLFKFSDPL